MKSSIMDNGIDWKKIGTSKAGAGCVGVADENVSLSVGVATRPQRPILPKAKATIRYGNDDQGTSNTGSVANIRSVNHAHENVSKSASLEPPVRNSHSEGGGMEMLDSDFILEVIEGLEGNSGNDVVMRKIGFCEIVRRDLENSIDSGALKIYSIDEDGHYGKNIQCRAMQELARRTV